MTTATPNMGGEYPPWSDPHDAPFELNRPTFDNGLGPIPSGVLSPQDPDYEPWDNPEVAEEEK